jgi:uncharacterized membrane protein YhaH (DUF805 family)
MNWYLEVLKKYAEFDGRARRKEYWMFALFNYIVIAALGVVFILAGMGKAVPMLVNLYQLAIVLPYFGVGIRRMHDTDHSGWWIIVPIVGLVLACMEGTQGPNRYGPDPKLAEQLVSTSP